MKSCVGCSSITMERRRKDKAKCRILHCVNDSSTNNPSSALIPCIWCCVVFGLSFLRFEARRKTTLLYIFGHIAKNITGLRHVLYGSSDLQFSCHWLSIYLYKVNSWKNKKGDRIA